MTMLRPTPSGAHSTSADHTTTSLTAHLERTLTSMRHGEQLVVKSSQPYVRLGIAAWAITTGRPFHTAVGQDGTAVVVLHVPTRPPPAGRCSTVSLVERDEEAGRDRLRNHRQRGDRVAALTAS